MVVRVLRLCSVFEPEQGRADLVAGAAARFDPVGGMQNHTASLSRCLDDLGVAQTILTSRLAAPTGVRPFGAHGRVRRVGLSTTRLRQLWAVCALPWVLVTRRPAVVHGHQGEDVAVLLLAMLAAAVHRCPLVVTLHTSVAHTFTGTGLRDRWLRAVGGAVEQAAVRRAAAVVVLVPRTREALVAAGVPADRVHVLPSGFEPGLFKAAREAADRFSGVPRPRIGYVGRLAPQKRPELLVAAFDAMSEDAWLVVVGDGSSAGLVDAAIAGSPKRDRITRRGFVPHAEVPAVLASLDVLALPSAYEEMGSVLVEAMASGLPVVASRVGGIPAVVRDGETGLLVPPLDVTALAAALDELAADHAAVDKLGEEALRQSVRYSWPGLARRVLDLYRAASR